MTRRRHSVPRSAAMLLGLGFMVLIAVTIASVWLAERSQAYADLVVATRKARGNAMSVATLVQAAESGQRGFLLTGEQNYLPPFYQAREALPGALAALRAVGDIEPDLRGPILRAEPLVLGKMVELDQTITLAEEGRHDAAIAVVKGGAGRHLMGEIRARLGDVIARLDGRLHDGSEALAENAQALLYVSIAGGTVIVLFAAAALWLLRRALTETERSWRAVERVNATLETRVQERTAELAQANEEVQRFAYIVSHDLRAPLVNVMGFTAELEAGLPAVRALIEAAEAMAPGQLPDQSPPQSPRLPTAEARVAAFEDYPEAIGFIRSSTARMDRLINAILKISREGRRALTAEPVEMTRLCRTLAATVQHQADAAAAEIEVAEDLPGIVSDRLALEQVFGNLLDNAVKYLDPARPGKVRVRGWREGRFAVFEVEDNGRGIPESDRERIFELFRRAGAQDRPGEGIGLAHVRTMVRRLGGTVACHSIPGQGARFRVVLPARLAVAKETMA